MACNVDCPADEEDHVYMLAASPCQHHMSPGESTLDFMARVNICGDCTTIYGANHDEAVDGCVECGCRLYDWPNKTRKARWYPCRYHASKERLLGKV